jgi:hypothetical protein
MSIESGVDLSNKLILITGGNQGKTNNSLVTPTS